MRAPTVCAESVCGPVVRRETVGHRVDHDAGDQAADHLRDNVNRRIDGRDAPDHELAESHGWVDVATGNRSDRIDEEQQGQAECEGNSEIADFRTCEDGSSDRGEHEHKCPHRFGRILLHIRDRFDLSQFLCSWRHIPTFFSSNGSNAHAPRFAGLYASLVISTTTSRSVERPPEKIPFKGGTSE